MRRCLKPLVMQVVCPTIQLLGKASIRGMPPGFPARAATVTLIKAHRLIEDEFYEVERFTSRADFLREAGAYNLWFNVARRNRGKVHRTPWELIHEREPKVDAAVCALPPVYLDELFMKKLDTKLMWGYDVIPHPFRYNSSSVGALEGNEPTWLY